MTLPAKARHTRLTAIVNRLDLLDRPLGAQMADVRRISTRNVTLRSFA